MGSALGLAVTLVVKADTLLALTAFVCSNTTTAAVVVERYASGAGRAVTFDGIVFLPSLQTHVLLSVPCRKSQAIT